mgnify:CR=1 FL=1
MTTVITTNVNIENEIKAIKQLEAEIKNLSDIKKDKENRIKSIMEQVSYNNTLSESDILIFMSMAFTIRVLAFTVFIQL